VNEGPRVRPNPSLGLGLSAGFVPGGRVGGSRGFAGQIGGVSRLAALLRDGTPAPPEAPSGIPWVGADSRRT
jgi:hypothetical protein